MKRNFEWKPPEPGSLKLDIDASTVMGRAVIGVGAVVCDHNMVMWPLQWRKNQQDLLELSKSNAWLFVRGCNSVWSQNMLYLLSKNCSPLSEESSILADVRH
ncbi:hypothetical protein TorRG33x02_181010 [Trema orientale]|uniref:Uncharacterized protein n=1 Tax=Trema orientale TaxID=63057 RepID=A0A2P5EKI9_TREOI|nr:hypothetical protein TorRG33x02_181010 [Trema orientale]